MELDDDIDQTTVEIAALREQADSLKDELGRLREANGRLLSLLDEQRRSLKGLIDRVSVRETPSLPHPAFTKKAA